MSQTAADQEQEGFYLKLRKVITEKLSRYRGEGEQGRLASYLLFLPDMFYLCTKLAVSPEVPPVDKAILAGAIAYLMSPVDLVPDMVFPLGFIDDLVVAAIVLNRINKSLNNQDIIRKYWVGDRDLFDGVREILNLADTVLGEKVMSKIRKKFG